jgi:hypothetical protein
MNYMNSSPNKGNPPRGTIRHTAPKKKPANKPMGSLQKRNPFASG